MTPAGGGMEATLRHSSAPHNHVRPTLIYAAVFGLAAGLDAGYPLRIDGTGAGVLQETMGAAVLVAGMALVVWCLRAPLQLSHNSARNPVWAGMNVHRGGRARWHVSCISCRHDHSGSAGHRG